MLTEDGLRERKWGQFPALRLALEGKSLSEEYYGWISTSDNIFERLPRLLEVGLLAKDFKDCVAATAKNSGWEAMHRDLEMLCGELSSLAGFLSRTVEEVYALHHLEYQAKASSNPSESGTTSTP